LRTANVTIPSSCGTSKRAWRPSSVLGIAGRFTDPLHVVGLTLSVVGTTATLDRVNSASRNRSDNAHSFRSNE
jgi:hypothetical protein